MLPIAVALAVPAALLPAVGASASVAPTSVAAATDSQLFLPFFRTTVERTPLLRNGTFENGSEGWRTLSTKTRSSVSARVGLHRTHGAVLPVRRTRAAGIGDSPNAATGVQAGDAYTASAWVRASRTTIRVRLVASRVVDGKAVATHTKYLKSRDRRWHKVSTSLTAKGGGEIDVRVQALRGPRGHFVTDNVQLVRSRNVTELPVTVPDPVPTPMCG